MIVDIQTSRIKNKEAIETYKFVNPSKSQKQEIYKSNYHIHNNWWLAITYSHNQSSVLFSNSRLYFLLQIMQLNFLKVNVWGFLFNTQLLKKKIVYNGEKKRLISIIKLIRTIFVCKMEISFFCWEMEITSD